MQRTRDTAPELAVRQLLHARGLRYFVDRSPLPGLRRRADVVFTRSRVAVFIDGCFWHGCPEHGRTPSSNTQWWIDKLNRTRSRDRETDERLAGAGWVSLRFWEHEDPDQVADEISRIVVDRRPKTKALPPSRS